MTSRGRWRCHHDVIVLGLLGHQYLSSLKVSLQLLFRKYVQKRVVWNIQIKNKIKKIKNFNENKSCFAALCYETANNNNNKVKARQLMGSSLSLLEHFQGTKSITCVMESYEKSNLK